MPDLLSSIGSFVSNSKALTPLLSLAGAGTNIYSGIQQVGEQQRNTAAQKYVNSLVENPAKMTAASAQYAQPLSAGLTSDITNTVQANLAERGLGSSPAAYTQQLTEALAPYIQQNQGTAMQTLLNSLGLLKPGGNTAAPFGDISQLLARLKLGTPQATNTGGSLDSILDQMQNPSNLDTSSVDLTSLIPEAA